MLNSIRRWFFLLGSRFVYNFLDFLDQNIWLPSKISETLQFRKSWKTVLKKSGDAKLWIHGASVGELEDLAEYFLSLKNIQESGIQPSQMVITASSVSASKRLEQWRETMNFLYCGPLPPDTAHDSELFLNSLRPQKFLLSQNDLWPNLYWKWKQSASSKTFYWYLKQKKHPSKSRTDFFKSLDPIVLSKSSSFEAKNMVSNSQVQLVGNLRLDRVFSRMSSAMSTKHVLEEWNASPSLKLPSIIVGSCRVEDAIMISKLPPSFFEKYHWVVMPHHTDDPVEVSIIHNLLGKNCHFVIAQGILLEAYKGFDVAWVGGGYSHSGVHNVLEALCWGIPTICGPNMQTQENIEHYQLIRALMPIADLENLKTYLANEKWKAQSTFTKSLAENLKSQIGSVNRLIHILRV